MKRILGFLLLLSSCGGPPREVKTFLFNVPGEDSSMALLPGQGVNHIDWTAKGFCTDTQHFQTQSGQSTGQFVEFRLLEITSVSALRESLHVTAAASFQASMFGRMSARMDYAKSVNQNSQSRYLLLHTRVGNQLNLATQFRFRPEAQALLQQGDTKRFLENCGTQFVYGYRTGGEFFALFEFEFSSAEEDRKFSAAIQASGVSWKASTEIASALQKFSLQARTHLSIYRMGGAGPLPDIGDIRSFALQYPTLVSTLHQHFVTLELITKDYSGVEPVNLSPNPGLLIRQDQVINQLARDRDHAVEISNTIRYIKLHPQEFSILPDSLDRSDVEITKYLNRVNQAAVNCFADIWNGCSVPELVFPSIAFPMRKVGTSRCESGFVWSDSDQKCCRNEIQIVCVAEDGAGNCLLYEERSVKICQ